MTTRLLLALALPLLAAAAPQSRQLRLAVPANNAPMLPVPSGPSYLGAPKGPAYEAAPLPNRDLYAPTGPRASNEPSWSPSLFTTPNQYRGDGFSRGSTAQTEQEKRVRPGAGFSLHMPFTGQ